MKSVTVTQQISALYSVDKTYSITVDNKKPTKTCLCSFIIHSNNHINRIEKPFVSSCLYRFVLECDLGEQAVNGCALRVISTLLYIYVQPRT